VANLMVFPAAKAATKMTVNGRSYFCPIGSIISVPDFDALVLCANGWLLAASDGSGTTAQRPPAPRVGAVYCDTTLGVNVVWNGASWCHHATGAPA
jgi:hypothetical protein